MDLTYDIDKQPKEYSKYNAIVVDSFLMGGFDENGWINEEKLYPLMNDEEHFKVYQDYIDIETDALEICRYVEDDMGKKIPAFYSQGQEGGITIELSNKSKDHWLNSAILAFSSDLDILIRQYTILNANNLDYQKSTSEFLVSLGFPDSIPFEIKEIYRVDIENDGIEEVLVNTVVNGEKEGEWDGSIIL